MYFRVCVYVCVCMCVCVCVCVCVYVCVCEREREREREKGRLKKYACDSLIRKYIIITWYCLRTNHHHHHHHVVPQARISLTLSRHFSLSSIASGKSSGLHPVSLHSCCMYVRAGRPAFAQPYVGVDGSTSLMSSSLLLQQCPACLVNLTWIVFVMGGRWP